MSHKLPLDIRYWICRTFLLGLASLHLLSTCATPVRPRSQLAFASDRAGFGDIFVVNEWGHLTNLTASPAGDWDPTWSPDSRTLAYTSHAEGQADIWLLDLQTHQKTNLTNHPAWDYSPAWSPDGQTLVFVSERDGDAEIFIQSRQQATARQLTFNTHPDKLPDWSADGSAIVFAAIQNDTERLYTLDLAQPHLIHPLLPSTGLNGTDPAWSPSGREIVFVGWRYLNQRSLYTINPATRQITRLYDAPYKIHALSWSSDEQWIFFTGWRNDNHDLMAFQRQTGQVWQLTQASAWDDFPAPHPQAGFTPNFSKDSAKVRLPSPKSFGYGVNLADLSNAYLIRDLGFNGIKGFVNWATVEQKPGRYRWSDPDNVVQAARGAGVQVLLRIHGVPTWAKPTNTTLSYPPTNLTDFERFIAALARRYRGWVMAYEIWNEPNLNYEWGYRDPSPAEYTALLKSAYRAIKAADPNALVITAGLAPTGDGNRPEVWGPNAFIEGMYQAGAKGYFDALGSHLYTYGRSPDYVEPGAITFDQLLAQRAIMVAHDDAQTPIWITEMGWILDTHWELGAYHNQGISQGEQAAYLARAYERIETEWPWVEAAYLFNLDFSLAPWYRADEQMRWFAILNPDHTPRPAFTALRQYLMALEKRQ